MNGKPFEGDFPGTAQQHLASHLKLREKLFIGLLLGFAFCHCSHAVDNTVVKETKIDETSKADTTSSVEGGSASETTTGPSTTTETGGWYEVVVAPGADKPADLATRPRPALPRVGLPPPPPVQIAPGVFEVYHPPVKVTEAGPVDAKANTWVKGTADVKTEGEKKTDGTEETEHKSSWNLGLKWYVWVAGILALALAGYIFRKSVPFLKWIP